MNKNSPKVSIVLPTYNGAKYIRQSIDSCLNQTYTNIELIIVDDGSMDETPEIVKSYKDERIKYIRHEKNMDLPHALNTGFSNVTGEYLTWTSDDNMYMEKAIEIMCNFLTNNPEYDVIYANYYHINENGKIIQSKNVEPKEKLIEYNCIGPCFLYRRKVYEIIGEYNPKEFLVEDYEYWIRVSKRFNMQNLNDFLYYHRLHSNSLTYTYEFEAKYRACQIRKKYLNGFNSRRDFAILYYSWGANLYHRNDPKGALKMLLKSFMLNPLHRSNWVLIFEVLIILAIPKPLIDKLSSIKQFLFRRKNRVVRTSK